MALQPSTFSSTFYAVVAGLALLSASFLAGVFIGHAHQAKNITELCNKIEAFTTPYGSFSCYPYEKQEKEEEIITEQKGAK